MQSSKTSKRFKIPKVVIEHMEGAEIYPESNFASNQPNVRARAIEDAEFLLDINFDGYEDYRREHARVKRFVELAKQYQEMAQ